MSTCNYKAALKSCSHDEVCVCVCVCVCVHESSIQPIRDITHLQLFQYKFKDKSRQSDFNYTISTIIRQSSLCYWILFLCLTNTL